MTRLIASDIDGTLAPLGGAIPKEVTDRLRALYEKGFHLYLVTGRTFTFAKTLLKDFDFPYFLSVQNGAVIVKMPTHEIVHKSYLPRSCLQKMDELFQNSPYYYVVEGGIEKEDTSFYQEDRFNDEDKAYFAFRKKISGAPWQPVKNYSQINLETIPLLKIFGPQGALKEIQTEVLKSLDVHAPLIKDPFKDQSILMITAKEATKGLALQWFLNNEMPCQEVIVAGDDTNDASMMELGTYRIVMETAPEELKRESDFIAPSASKMGILEALKNL